jgi:hypothetical protein
MKPLRTSAALLALAAALSACSGIRVRPVTYRLKGNVAGPLNHGTVSDGRARFAETFCATLQHINNNGGQWGPCENYLEIDQPVTPATLGDIPPVRLLLVAGVFSECLAADGVTMFKDAARHLMDPQQHQGIQVEHLAVPALGTSGANAKIIRDFIVSHPGPFIVVGYSKGAGDLMEMIADYAEVRPQIAALVTVAGSVGGSRLADQFSSDFLKWMQGAAGDIGLQGCRAADAGGITSLTRPDRFRLLQRYPVGAVPSFSVAAVATSDNISTILRANWRQLQAFSLDEDSQVIADDAVVPGGTFLGIARADHWAIALPFDETTDPVKRRRALRWVDKNSYPRTALLEAIVRFFVTN